MEQQYPMFGYLQDVQRMAQQMPPEPNMVMPSFDGVNRENFIVKMGNIGILSDNEIIHLIKENIDSIVNDVLSNNIPYIHILFNKRFIANFIKVMHSIPIDYTKRVCCNKISYEYLCEDVKDEEVKKAFLNLSMVTNRDIVNSLISLGLDESLSAMLAMSRFSSVKEKINAERLNFVIAQEDPNLMTEQMIVYIYEKLFDKITDLFVATMLEVYSPEEQLRLGPDFMEVYGTIGLAVLTIVNNMPLENIKHVLISYATDWEYNGRHETRFSLRNLSADYSRISQVVHALLKEGYYNVP